MGDRDNVFGNSLREWRTGRALTQTQAATMFDCSQGWYSLIERGLEDPSPHFQTRFEALRTETPQDAKAPGPAQRRCAKLLQALARRAETEPKSVEAALTVAVQLLRLGTR